MKAFVLLSLLTVAAFNAASAHPDPAKKAVKSKAQSAALKPQIVGGQNVTSPFALPFQVHVDAGGTCGGAIIDDDWVITAAHCVADSAGKAKPVTLTIGSKIVQGFSPKKIVMSIDVSRVYVHSGYNATSLANDIAMIRLHFPLVFESKNATMGKLEMLKSSDYGSKTSKNKTFASETVTLVGWGKTNDTEDVSNVLKMVNTTVMTNAACNEALVNFSISAVNDQHICVAAELGGKAACQGDSGGPMVYFDVKAKKAFLLGLTSYGGNCSDGSPGVYVRVSYYLKWIETNLKLK